MSDKRFAIGGLEVAVRPRLPGMLDHMAGFYDHYPSHGGTAAAIIDVDVVPDFHEGRERGPSYPGFESERLSADVVRFSRYDAEGTVDASGAEVRASFTVGHSPNSLEAAVRIAVSTALPAVGAIIFHASAVSGSDGIAQLFLGISGRGKSTIAQILEDAGATKVSDELVVVRRCPGGFEAVVSPFIGSVGLPHGKSFPLGALNLLVQAPTHARRDVSAKEALPQLLRHAVTFAKGPAIVGDVMDLLLDLLAKVPCYELEFARRADVADAILLTC